jgi:hypothetical protein
MGDDLGASSSQQESSFDRYCKLRQPMLALVLTILLPDQARALLQTWRWTLLSSGGLRDLTRSLMKRRDTVSTAAMRGDGVMCTELKRLGKSEIGLLHNAVAVDGINDGVHMKMLRS